MAYSWPITVMDSYINRGQVQYYMYGGSAVKNSKVNKIRSENIVKKEQPSISNG